MSSKTSNTTNFTRQVQLLLQNIYGRSKSKTSVRDRAIDYFETVEENKIILSKIQNKIDHWQEKEGDKSKIRLSISEAQLNELQEKLTQKRLARFNHLKQICLDIIELSEGDSLDETHKKSAQLLATIQLLTPTNESNIAYINERNKPLYKSVLTLRLLDQLYANKMFSNGYIHQILQDIDSENHDELITKSSHLYKEYVDMIKVPVIMATILQDIGNYHPKAQQITCGPHNEFSPFRTLDIEERKTLLTINYTETLRYINDGIGTDRYAGSSSKDKKTFDNKENMKKLFINFLLKNSIAPKRGLGNLLKIPQIYSSIVMSTKENFNYQLLPKVYNALYQNVERGLCMKELVDMLRNITGDFPLGYGVVFIPEETGIDNKFRYEYAIVTYLFPETPEEPKCRVVSRHLTFIGHGQDLIIKQSANLHNLETLKKFSQTSQKRLNQILESLSSDSQERKNLGIAPRCWHPEEYFAEIKNQKLWNKPVTLS